MNSLPLDKISNQIYYWADSPFFGLDQVKNLDLDAKRKYLFGHSMLDTYLADSDQPLAVVFSVYMYLKSNRPHFESIYIPTFFLGYCREFLDEFAPAWHWNSSKKIDVAVPMHKPRYSRLIASCWLANNQKEIDFVYTQNWSGHEATVDELLQLGGLIDWTREWGPENIQLPKYQIPIDQSNDVSPVRSDFKHLYKSVYSEAASCVVIGGAGWEHGCELCEKYLFAVYSGCIPVVHGYRVYDRLKLLGFDTFDDIIDSSSQYDPNPITAAWNLLDHNRVFFQNAKKIWQQSSIQRRLRHNFQLICDIQSIYRSVLTHLNTARARQLYHTHFDQIQTRLKCQDLLNHPLSPNP